MAKGSKTNRSVSIPRLAFFLCLALSVICMPSWIFGAEAHHNQAAVDHTGEIVITFLWLSVILILAKTSSLIERIGQPAVLGELLIGVAMGSIPLLGLHIFEPIKSNEIIQFLAELGVVILLFQIGMESSVETMMRVGVPSLLVALVGVFTPFISIAFFVAPWFLPGLSKAGYLFIGATMTATSVGITARVLKDLNKLQIPEARVILGAAVIDDVLGLIILAVVSAIVEHGSIDLSALFLIIAKAVIFLVGGIFVGTWMAPRLSALFSRIQTGIGMKFALVISFALIFAYLASFMGLAPIVGAFAAGLILEPVYFKNFENPKFVKDLQNVIKGETAHNSLRLRLDNIIKIHSQRHIEEFADTLGHFVTPVFFVLTGMQVKIESLFDSRIALMSVGLLIVSILGKVVAGYVSGRGMNKLAIGVGMSPRGEVGLIFANIGKGFHVMNDAVFSAVVVVIMMTTLVVPPFLAYLLRDK